MKKSQILAALALAFALGVVAPVASTHAAIVGEGTTVSEAQMKNLKADVKAANSAYSDLEKVDQYVQIYNDIEADNGLRTAISDKTEALLDSYNDNKQDEIDRPGINAVIETLSDAASSSALYKKNADGKYAYIKSTSTFDQAQLRSMSNLDEVNTFADAYKAVKNLADAAAADIQILTDNYDNSSDTVTNAIDNATTIKTAAEQWLNVVKTTFAGMAATPAQYAENDLKAISEEAYKTLVNGQAWKDASKDANLENYTKYNLFMNAAGNLPKYSYVKALVDAKTNFDKINDANQAVDYDVALNYIAAFNTAIKNFREGKAPVDPTNPDDGKDDDKKDPSAPDTGIVADADSNASSTVAMVAGVATALTAAGAGVVAYRNARRSTRK